MYDVFFFEAFDEEAEALRGQVPRDVKAGFTARTLQEAAQDKPPARLISIRTQSDLPVAGAPELAGILSRSTGYDHLTAYALETGAELALGYLPRYCCRSVAEQALLLWMALLRRLPLQMEHARTFDRDGLTGRECVAKELLVVGVGNIGQEIVRIGCGLGMSVRGVDLVERHAEVAYVDIDPGLAAADIVVCAMNLTRTNRGYFAYDRLKQCKPGALFVNVARGEFVSCVDLLRLLEEGALGGVGLDVYPQENALAFELRSGAAVSTAEARAVRAMRRRDDVILTPHNAFNTREAVERKARQSMEQVEAFRTTGRFKWPVPQRV